MWWIALWAGADAAAAEHWNRGEVQRRDGWIAAGSYEEKSLPPDAARRRAAAGVSVEARRAFAKWCAGHGLPEEAAAQYGVVAWHDPSNATAQRALGRQLRNGWWGTDDERARRRESAQAARAAEQRWSAAFRALPKPVAALPTDLDPAAIRALEREVSLASESGAKLAVASLAAMPHSAATASLVRHALYSRWPAVRQAASAALANRPLQDSVPALLLALQPATSQSARGALGEVWLFRDMERAVVLSSPEFVRAAAVGDIHRGFTVTPQGEDAYITSAPALGRSASGFVLRPDGSTAAPGNAVDALQTERADAIATELEASAAARQANAQAALAAVSGKDFGPEAKAWGQWFAETTDRFVDADAEKDLPAASVQETRMTIGVVGASSCFAAGTPVWTARGPQAIDRIVPGDRVLSRHAETGELKFQAVVRHTVVPTTATRTLRVAGDAIRATTVHPVWVEGRGWVEAKNLSAGMTVRLVGKIAPLDAVEPGEPAQGHNLILADGGTYFVGKVGVLVHDNTPIVDWTPLAKPMAK